MHPAISPQIPRPRLSLLILAYLAFVSLGLPDAVLGIVWPSMRHTFGLPQAAMGAILATNAAAYFLSGLLAGRLMRSVGLGALLAGSTGLVAVGLGGYASAPAFFLLLGAACLIGFGSGAVDSALNTYAARQFEPRHMAWLHAAYSVGAALGPALMTALLARNVGWRAGYAVIGLVLGAMALAFLSQRSRWTEPSGSSRAPRAIEERSRPSTSGWQALRRPQVRLQIALFFLYSGAEVGVGQWAFTVLTESRGMLPSTAGVWVTLFWSTILGGRILSGFVVERIGWVSLLRLCTAGVALGTAVFALTGLPAGLAGAGLLLTGGCLAPIFPGLMSETPRRVGEDAAPHAVGFQVSAATLGVGVIPSVAGLAGERWGLATVPMLLALVAVALAVTHQSLIRMTEPARYGARSAVNR